MLNYKIVKIFFLFIIFFSLLAVYLGIGKYIKDLLGWISFFILNTIVITFIIMLYLNKEYIFRKSRESEKFKVSVVVPFYNEGENIIQTIESLLNVNYPKDKLELIFVDDGSTDNTGEIVKRYPVKYFRKQNGGAASAKNYGIAKSTGEIIITMDSDSVIDKNAIRRIVSYFEDESVGAVAGTIRARAPKNLIQKWQSVEYDLILIYRRILEAYDSVYVTPGGLSAFRKSALEEVGYFDEKSLTEDQEIAMALQKKGYKVLCSLDAYVYTTVPESLLKLIKQRVRWIRGGIYNRIKHQDLLDLKWGNLFIFGYLLDILFFIPFVTVFIGTILLLMEQYFWVERLGLDVVGLMIDQFFVTSLIFWLVSLPWQLYMLNYFKDLLNETRYSILDFLGFMFIFGFGWFFVWFVVMIKEIKGERNLWETR
jgi:peptidoglycan-N-acetylglucosamine deacetylase